MVMGVVPGLVKTEKKRNIGKGGALSGVAFGDVDSQSQKFRKGVGGRGG